ncbi:MAG: hypothetical protein PHC64_03385 [Candidatus Gastranaerophilales bacterium]|nr:hypothetical protein [Candidatus Gastranaerophilales bacterium]
MQNNTKKYLKNLIDYLEIELNTIKAELRVVIKIKNKLQKFYKKVINNY